MLKLIHDILASLGLGRTSEDPPQVMDTKFRNDGPKTHKETAALLRALADTIENKAIHDDARGLVVPELIDCKIRADEDQKESKVKYAFKVAVDWTALVPEEQKEEAEIGMPEPHGL